MKNSFLRIFPILALAALASCASKKTVTGTAVSTAAHAGQNSPDNAAAESLGVEQAAFLQSVSDNQVYATDIVADASLKIEMGAKRLSCDGQLRMRRDKIIRLQVLLPIIRTEIARVDFTPDGVLLVDRYHKEYIEADYSQVSFLAENGITFHTLQSLFWNQLFAPGEQTVSQQTLGRFAADLAAATPTVPVTLSSGRMSFRWDAEKASGRIVKATVTYESPSHSKSQLVWDYADFRALGVKMFPARQQFSFETEAAGKRQSGTVSVNMGTLRTSSDWDTATVLSSKYRKIESRDILKKITSLQ